MVKILNDILLALEKKQQVLLVLLDLSAAFDTVDHILVINRLWSDVGLDGTRLNGSHLISHTNKQYPL